MKKLMAICTMVFVLLCFTSCESLTDDDWFNIGFAGGSWLSELSHREPDNSDRHQPAIKQRTYKYLKEFQVSY